MTSATVDTILAAHCDHVLLVRIERQQRGM